jgi:hypothetical protein
MPEIPLTQGKVAIVSDEDYDFLMQFKWYVANIKGEWRAMRASRKPNRERTVQYMHRVIVERMGIKAPTTDHIDRDTLNNRRENLRGATSSQNGHNQGIAKNNTSGYTGVCWNKREGRWQAVVGHLNRKHFLGHFDDPAVASERYQEKKRELAGAFTPEEIKDA